MTPDHTIAPASHFDFSNITDPNDTVSAHFGAARELAQGQPSRAAFLSLCKLVERIALSDRERLIEALLPYLTASLTDWPSKLRMAPLLWINRLITFALPVEALSITSALSLTAAMAGSYSDVPNRLLYSWLQQLPADAPSLEGLSINRTNAHFQAIRAAETQEPEPRFHTGQDLSYIAFADTMFWDMWDETYEPYEVLFGAPINRKLRVIDMALEPISKHIDSDEIFYGRNWSLGNILFFCSSEQVEVISLYGQALSIDANLLIDVTDSEDEEDRTFRRKLKSLRKLDLSGGVHIGDPVAKRIAQNLPSLEWLNISNGYITSHINDRDFRLEDDDFLQRRLGIYDDDQLQRLMLTQEGIAALQNMPKLNTLHSDKSFQHLQLWAQEFNGDD